MRGMTIAWKNLHRRPARSLLTVAGLAIAIAAVVSLVGVAESFENSFLALYSERGADLVVQRRGAGIQLSKGIPRALGDRIRALSGAGQVVGGLMDLVAFEERGLMMVLVNGWDPDCPVLDRVRVVAGRRLRAGDRNGVMLGRILAANLGKRPGDTVEVYARPFHVVGVFESFSVYENGALFMLLDDLQRQMDRPGQVTGFIVQADPPGDSRAIAALRRRIELLDANVAATPCVEFVRSLTQMRVARAMAWVTSAIAGFLAAFGVLNTMAMSVFERRAEIGAMRALGWRMSRVVRLILAESLILTAAGAVLGAVLGLAAAAGLARWHVTAGLVEGTVPLSAIGEGLILAATAGSFGALGPALRIARTAPVDALRGA